MRNHTSVFIVLIFVSNFYIVPIFAKRTIRITRFDGRCRKTENPKIVSLFSGINIENQKLVMNGTITVTEDVRNFSLTVNIQRCTSKENPDSCVNLYSFTYRKGCQLIESKIEVFNAFYKSIHPPWKCPLKKRLNVLYEKNWTRLVTEQLKRFERAVVESGKIGGASSSQSSHWTFGGALLYSVTLLTTVGYGKLSPKTAIGKVVAIIYAIIGVPLMLILLSALGSLLASGARSGYSKLCCKQESKQKIKSPTVGYHKAPSSPSGKHYCKNHEDTASIQLASSHSTPNHVRSSYQYVDHQEVPKRAILATVRSSYTRGRCRQGPVRQMLADPPVPMCPTHSHGTPVKNSLNSSIIGISSSSDLDDADDTDENEHICTHDTPSRIPLIWRPPESRRSPTPPLSQTSPSVPAILVLIFFVSYVCVGAAAFSSASGWNFLDAIYFCFIALSTIGVGDKLPQSSEFQAQAQLFACCVYLFLGLVVVAMCFSLVHEELTLKCRQVANNVGLLRH